ncbi:MAG: regulatory protein RecX [Bacteroidota bacterium]
MEGKKKHLSRDEALVKLQRYCAYQDRCHQEVRSKLIDLGIYGHDLELVIAALISENFLNEERFACSYARGKFRIKRWGKVKIKRELVRRNISTYCISKAMEELEEEDYQMHLQVLLEQKLEQERAKNEFRKKAKVAQYAIRKGFEAHLVWEILNSQSSNKK